MILSTSALTRWADRIAAARVIAGALIQMSGSDVKACFEAAAGGQLVVTYWRRRDRPNGAEDLIVQGRNATTGRSFVVISAPFRDGRADAAAAALGAVALSQQGSFMAGVELKIKGLAEAVRTAREGIAGVRMAASNVDEAARAFVASAEEVKTQIDAARSDLEFEATQLGNGGPGTTSDNTPVP